jgi:DNA phosphorothioation-dependent restriction protein DptG
VHFEYGCCYLSFIILYVIGNSAYCSHLVLHFEVFFCGSFVGNALPLFFYVVTESVHSLREEVFESKEVAKRVPAERTGPIAP